jgi:hypothetical protein
VQYFDPLEVTQVSGNEGHVVRNRNRGNLNVGERQRRAGLFQRRPQAAGVTGCRSVKGNDLNGRQQNPFEAVKMALMTLFHAAVKTPASQICSENFVEPRRA